MEFRLLIALRTYEPSSLMELCLIDYELGLEHAMSLASVKHHSLPASRYSSARQAHHSDMEPGPLNSLAQSASFICPVKFPNFTREEIYSLLVLPYISRGETSEDIDSP